MKTLDDLPIVDSTGYPVDIGSEVDGGNGVVGEIIGFPERCNKGKLELGVCVEWPDRDFPQAFPTQLAFAGSYVVLQCPEIVSLMPLRTGQFDS